MTKNNIYNNRLSLKSLQAELDALKNSNNNKSNEQNLENPPLKQKNILARFTTKSSAFGLWIFTALLSYGHKIPIIKQLIKILSLWYGRTTWWKTLVSLRKTFIIINALLVFTQCLK